MTGSQSRPSQPRNHMQAFSAGKPGKQTKTARSKHGPYRKLTLAYPHNFALAGPRHKRL